MARRRKNSNTYSTLELKQIKAGLEFARTAMLIHYKANGWSATEEWNYTEPETNRDHPTSAQIVHFLFKGKDPLTEVLVEMLGVEHTGNYTASTIPNNVDMTAMVNNFGLVSAIKVSIEDPYDSKVIKKYLFDPYTQKKIRG